MAECAPGERGDDGQAATTRRRRPGNRWENGLVAQGADGMTVDIEPLALDPVGEAVGRARRYVRSSLIEMELEPLVDSATLGVSELVTNAVLHGRTAFTVSIRSYGEGRVRIEVSDLSGAVPRQRHFDSMATTGRGLRIVESISSTWGVDYADDGLGKTVWFEPAGEDASSGFAAQDWASEIEGLL